MIQENIPLIFIGVYLLIGLCIGAYDEYKWMKNNKPEGEYNRQGGEGLAMCTFLWGLEYLLLYNCFLLIPAAFAYLRVSFRIFMTRIF